MIVFIHTDFPDPVVPAINRWGIEARSPIIGVPDKKWGETGKAYIVLKPDCNLSEEDIINHCLKNLAKFKIPASVDFIAALPRNATGKVLKRNLREEVVGSDAPAIT